MDFNTHSVTNRLIMKQFGLQVFLFILALFVIFMFQNCAPMPEEKDLQSMSEALPFAYDLKVDHFAYMSCNNAPQNSSTFFTFKAGAFAEGSGMRFRDEYLSSTKKFSPDERAQALQYSILNANVRAQITLRQVANFQSAIQYGFFQGPLSTTSFAQTLASLTGNNRVRLYGSQELQGQFNMGTHNEASLRSSLSTEDLAEAAFVGVTFNQPRAGEKAAATPDFNSAATVVYGSGFRATFRSPMTGAPERALNVVQERNLETGEERQWSCPSSYVFKIFHPADVGGKGTCIANAGNTNEEKEAYNTLRKFLPASQWVIDAVNKCVIPIISGTALSCYGIPSNQPTQIFDYNSCNGANNCPHFVSVCKRQ